MFDTLANRLQDALGDLGRRSRLDEETVTRATREIRLALLEADVDFEVVKQFALFRSFQCRATEAISPALAQAAEERKKLTEVPFQ